MWKWKENHVLHEDDLIRINFLTLQHKRPGAGSYSSIGQITEVYIMVSKMQNQLQMKFHLTRRKLSCFKFDQRKM